MGMMVGDEIFIDNVTMRKAGPSDAVSQRIETPSTFNLYPNHPNPFNPTTKISFSLQNAGDVSLVVYNQKGQLLKTLVNGFQAAGSSHVTWDGRDANGTMQPSGLYYARLSADGQSKTIKMLLMK
jgi:flagellar hook assembly protein FlgD